MDCKKLDDVCETNVTQLNGNGITYNCSCWCMVCGVFQMDPLRV